MTPEEWSFRSRRVVTAAGVGPARVAVRAGEIVAVAESSEPVDLDFGDLAVLPGLVDSHVHCNDPGRTEWEGFATATRAAAAGGITALVDMPLNSIPATTSRAALASKRDAAAGRLTVDVGFWGGLVPGDTRALAELWQDGVLGFKCFLVPSGVPEFEAVTPADLDAGLGVLAALGAPLLVHAEAPEEISPVPAAERRSYAAWAASRPPRAEARAIHCVAERARRVGARVHIVHVASAAGVEAVVAARAAGCAITAETCPHYLSFAAEEIADGATLFKCAPPIRSATEREALWRALADGRLDLVASDHSPSPPAGKALASGDFVAAWGGISSLQLALCATWTAATERGFGLDDVARWMSAAPSRLAGLARKGGIAVGRDADFVVFDPDATFVVDAATLEHRHKLTPYDGRRLRGRVARTYLRGELVYDGGAFPGPRRGQLLARATASATVSTDQREVR